MGRGRDEARKGVHDKPGLEARLREDRWRAEVGHDDQRLFSAVALMRLSGLLTCVDFCVYITFGGPRTRPYLVIASCSQGARGPFFSLWAYGYNLRRVCAPGYVHPGIRKTTPRPCILGDLAESRTHMRTQDPKTNATPRPLSARRGLWRPSENTSTRGGPAVDLVGVLGLASFCHELMNSLIQFRRAVASVSHLGRRHQHARTYGFVRRLSPCPGLSSKPTFGSGWADLACNGRVCACMRACACACVCVCVCT